MQKQLEKHSEYFLGIFSAIFFILLGIIANNGVSYLCNAIGYPTLFLYIGKITFGENKKELFFSFYKIYIKCAILIASVLFLIYFFSSSQDNIDNIGSLIWNIIFLSLPSSCILWIGVTIFRSILIGLLLMHIFSYLSNKWCIRFNNLTWINKNEICLFVFLLVLYLWSVNTTPTGIIFSSDILNCLFIRMGYQISSSLENNHPIVRFNQIRIGGIKLILLLYLLALTIFIYGIYISNHTIALLPYYELLFYILGGFIGYTSIHWFCKIGMRIHYFNFTYTLNSSVILLFSFPFVVSFVALPFAANKSLVEILHSTSISDFLNTSLWYVSGSLILVLLLLSILSHLILYYINKYELRLNYETWLKIWNLRFLLYKLLVKVFYIVKRSCIFVIKLIVAFVKFIFHMLKEIINASKVDEE